MLTFKSEQAVIFYNLVLDPVPKKATSKKYNLDKTIYKNIPNIRVIDDQVSRSRNLGRFTRVQQ